MINIAIFMIYINIHNIFYIVHLNVTSKCTLIYETKMTKIRYEIKKSLSIFKNKNNENNYLWNKINIGRNFFFL